jgi:hypothetical protein
MIYIILALAMGVHIADWLQTRWISVFGEITGIYETNKLLGRKPRLPIVDAYFSAALILLCGAVVGLRYVNEWAAIALGVIWLLVEFYFVIRNRELKIGFYFGMKY